jgi:DNA-binding NtrC family response regulator
VVQRAFVMAEGEQITDEWLPSDAPSGSSMAAAHGDETVLIIKVGTSMAEMQRQLTLATLHHCKQHKEKTAAVLDISLKTLYKRLKEYAAAGWAPADAGHLDGEAAHGAD